MFLTGLTLEVQDMVFSGKEPSPVILEIRSSSPGMRETLKTEMERLTSDGCPEISNIRWIEGKLYLTLLDYNAVQELHDLRTALSAESAESEDVHALDREAESPRKYMGHPYMDQEETQPPVEMDDD